jgi:hypothetical protein
MIGDGVTLYTALQEIEIGGFIGGAGAASFAETGGASFGLVVAGSAILVHGANASGQALADLVKQMGIVFHSSSENSGNNEQQPPRQQREVYDEQGKRWTEADVSGQTGTWNKGTYENPEASLLEHFKKHGREVDAKDPLHYLRKAEGFKGNARKRSRKTAVEGGTPGVMRYSKNGLYIDMTPDNQIISFGATNN